MASAGTINAGLIGRGIAQSQSPAIHGREARALGIALHYDLIDFDALKLDDGQLAWKLKQLSDLGFAGVNITHPFKQAVIPLLDEVEPTANALGAVNCVAFTDGRMVGSNSDWMGFTFLMERQLPGASLDCVALIGAGGAGSATAYALMQMGADELRIVDEDLQRAQELANRLQGVDGQVRITCPADAASAITDATGIVQATPVGMASYPGVPVDPQLLCAGQWLADLIYFPRETELMHAASAKGLRVAGGSAMAVGQAGLPFTQFTGVEPDMDRMLASFLAADRADDAKGQAA